MKFRTLFCLLLLPLIAGAQSLQDAQGSIMEDLEAAEQELASLREEIREERVPLAQRLNALRAEAQEKRRQVERINRQRDNRALTIERLKETVESLRQNLDFLENSMNEYARRFESTLTTPELQIYKAEYIDPVLEFAGGEEDMEVERMDIFDAQFALLGASFERLENVLGGAKTEGQAILPDGEQVTGTFLLLGPVSYFSSNEEVGMISMLATDRIRPKVIADIPGIEAVSSIIAGGEGRVPFDPTMNDALELQVNRVSLQQEIQAGGVFIWPIIGFAALAILIAIFKFFEIYSVKIPSENTIEEIVQLVNEGQRAEALKQARAIPGPFGRLMLDAVEHADERKELIEEVLYERMLETRPQLERMLAFIAVTAATSPLLGLLGTVTGMIKTFQQITLFGTSDASKLAGGISEALITTKWGLIAAIPALILHALLSRKAQGVLAGMEKFSATFINGLQQKAGKKS